MHIVRAGAESAFPDDPSADVTKLRKLVEPWLAALLQSEHLSLLLGSGLTMATASHAGAELADMGRRDFDCEYAAQVNAHADAMARSMGRGEANFEDQLSAALAVAQGLQIAGESDTSNVWYEAIDKALADFLHAILRSEQSIADKLQNPAGSAESSGLAPHHMLISFLLSFASRTPSRERLHIFTTNYDRLVEFGCDLAGLRTLDRFVGTLSPVFRASRLGIDLHYNPPGIRGEPRYLEGVAQLTKLHGSIDWKYEDRILRRIPLAFGAPESHPEVQSDAAQSTIIYPNSAKDVETAWYPYAELFRDFSAALCRPNSALVTYGYGFGDDHISRVISDMLTIPSTHLVIISYGESGEQRHQRVKAFCERVGREQQITLLLGPHFGDIAALVGHYLPKPAIDPITFRMGDLLERRRKTQERTEGAQAGPTVESDG